jgi:hypothetical protein
MVFLNLSSCPTSLASITMMQALGNDVPEGGFDRVIDLFGRSFRWQ